MNEIKKEANNNIVANNQVTQKKIIYKHPVNDTINQELLSQRRIVAMEKHKSESDVFKILRTKILKQLRMHNWNSFAITSPTKNSGKTTVSVNLAITMAMDLNQIVLLVDMNLRNPKVDWYFDMETTAGLKDHILSDVPLSDILIDSGSDRLFILPGRGQVDNPSEMIASPKMRELVKTVKTLTQPQITIFDLPPILGTDDVLASTAYYDAMLLVIEDGGNTPDEIKKALQMVSDINSLGTVLNKADSFD